MTTQEKIDLVCNNLREFLKEKNKRYGDSALYPINVFSKQDNVNSIYIRLDDKLKRIQNSNILRQNDVQDLTGYLILLLIAKDWSSFEDFID